MIDYLAAALPDPFGQAVGGGEVCKIDEHGEVQWVARCKKDVRGSWDGSLRVRNLMAEETVSAGIAGGKRRKSGLEIDGNPAKFVHGHNLFGTSDLAELVKEAVSAVARALHTFPVGPEQVAGFDFGEGTISRIDLTGSWLLPCPGDVLPFLDAMRESVFCPYRGRGTFANNDPGTLYYGYSEKGKRAKDWQLKLYSKGRELAKRPLPERALAVPGLLDDVNRTVRVELTLRGAELKRLGLSKVKDWTETTAAKVWQSYVDRLDVREVAMKTSDQLAGLLKPRHFDALQSWEAGNDLRIGRSRGSWYRLRKELLALAKVDIAIPVPKSNVVPLKRIVVAELAPRPAWADDLTTALAA